MRFPSFRDRQSPLHNGKQAKRTDSPQPAVRHHLDGEQNRVPELPGVRVRRQFRETQVLLQHKPADRRRAVQRVRWRLLNASPSMAGARSVASGVGNKKEKTLCIK
ncbi:Hypothetical_protein [Hexamita inflata]|uniref:Hypothetical_protein n=1 Tax=Hexamita inflata TaxID=28002 RepID=A0AA86PU09_9EUKA|nr:Hypothetical protein HINF_LOCUS32593 [Hexamita inflata]